MTLLTKLDSPSKLKKWAGTHRELAKTVCLAKAFAEVEKERVDAYILPVFETFEFAEDCEGGSGEKITDPERLYLSEDEKLATTYYAACDKAHREHGFDGPEGHSPALIAGHLLIQAENLLLDELCKLMGVESISNLDLRDKALDWGLSVCLGKIV
jgi:hypothetical protein